MFLSPILKFNICDNEYYNFSENVYLIEHNLYE